MEGQVIELSTEETLLEETFLWIETNKAVGLVRANLFVLQAICQGKIPEKGQELMILIQDFLEELENYL